MEQVLARFSELVSNRDLAILDEFAEDAVLVGSEPGEVARGSAELATFFETFFALPVRVSWRWDSVQADSAWDVAWFFAEGEARAQGPGADNKAAYRLSGTLRWEGGRWLWHQFHGAEPRAA